MRDHYIRLLTNRRLNDKQVHIWRRAVDKFVDGSHAPDPENFIDQFTAQRDELEGTDEFPHVYVVYLDHMLETTQVGRLVDAWSEIFPLDFEIDTSAEYNCDDGECELEVDDAMHEEIQRRAARFLHNRWVEHQVQEGWRYGLRVNNTERTDPKLRDWDSLHESMKRELEMTREQAVQFFQRYPHLFV